MGIEPTVTPTPRVCVTDTLYPVTINFLNLIGFITFQPQTFGLGLSFLKAIELFLLLVRALDAFGTDLHFFPVDCNILQVDLLRALRRNV